MNTTHRHSTKCDGFVHCHVCGKPMSVAPSYAQGRTDTGRLYAAFVEVPAEKSQGYFEVGPDCNRRIRLAGEAGL